MAQYCVHAWHYSALVWRNTVSMLGTIVRQYSAMQLLSLKQHKNIARPFSRAIYIIRCKPFLRRRDNGYPSR